MLCVAEEKDPRKCINEGKEVSRCGVEFLLCLVLQEFMLCVAEEKDPRKCINEGKEVSRCGVEFFQKLRDTCAEEFATYWTCIDHSCYDMNFRK